MAPKPKPKAQTKSLLPPSAPGAATPVAAANPYAAAAAPSPTAGEFGVSTTDASLPLVGDNSDILGPSTTKRTIGDAVSALHALPQSTFDQIQQSLVDAHILTGKYNQGDRTDTATLNAFRTAVEDATRNGLNVSTYIDNTKSSALISSATAAQPSYSDPALVQTSLESAFASEVGRAPTAAEMATFTAQIAAKDSAKTSDKISVDVPSEATLFAQGVAAKSGGTTKAASSTDADITKSAAAMGVQLNPQQRQNIAAKVDANTKATGAPDVNLLNQLVAQQFRMPTDLSTLTGDAATVRNDLLALNSQYLLPVDDKTVNSFVTKAIQTQSYAGSLADDTKATYEQYLRGQAAVTMPWLAQATQNFASVTPYAATASYRTQISNVLGLGDPDTVDLSPTSKYNKLLAADPKTGAAPTMGSITDQILNAPNDAYGYDTSPNGIARGYNIGSALAKSMGVQLAGV